ncbi:MAG: hypothetical protein WA117_25430 [Verrucomicrobiia bacterium]
MTLLASGVLWFAVFLLGLHKWERSKAEAVLLLTLSAGFIVWHAGRVCDWWRLCGEEEAQSIVCELLENPKSDLAKEITEARVYVDVLSFRGGPHRYRFCATPAAIQSIVKRYELKLVDPKDRESTYDLKYFWDDLPWWWKPNKTGAIIYSRGPRSILLYDEAAQVTYFKHW